MCPEALEPLASFLELAQGAQNREHGAVTCSWAPSEGEPEHPGSGNWTAPFAFRVNPIFWLSPVKPPLFC